MVYGSYSLIWLVLLTSLTLGSCCSTLSSSFDNVNPEVHQNQPILSHVGDMGLAGSSVAVKPIVQSHYNGKKLSAVKREMRGSFLINPKIKLALTTFSTFCVLFELLETLVEQVPMFHRFSKRFMKFQFGVLVLCLSQGMHLISELFEHLGEREEAKEETEKEEEIEQAIEKTFDSEEEAARAYDATAIGLYSHAAQLNYHYPNQELDENGQLPHKQSKYRGVRWNNALNAWQVDCRYLTPPQHHLQQQQQSHRKRHC